jgi:anti-anti-sigma factor
VHRDGQTLRVVGEVDLATCHLLVAALDDLAANTAGEVAVDCSSVTFFGAVAVDALVQARNRLADSRRLVVRNPSPIVRRVLDIVQLREVFADVFDDEHHPTPGE